MNNVLVICLAVILPIIVIVLAVVIYHQMLLVNALNNKLLLLVQESIQKERLTMEELREAVKDFESLTDLNQTLRDSDTPYGGFNPHEEDN